MELPEPEDERIAAQSQAQDRRAKWQPPKLRRIEAGSAEGNFGLLTDGVQGFQS